LVILDGWSVPDAGDALARAHTPNLDEIRSKYPSTTLAASGPAAGMPDGEVVTSEIGHMNIGAGRAVRTDAARIAESIRTGEFFENQVLKRAFETAASSRVHFVGLLSDGDTHASLETLYALLRMAKRSGVTEAYVHAILDGRDVPERTADIYVEALEIKMADIGLGEIATLCGRFFAMDDTQNWERTARAYTMLALADGERYGDARTAIRSSFLRGIADEFIAPIVIERSPDVPVATVRDGDVVVFFNHRGDGMRQLVRSLAMPEVGSPRSKPAIHAVCLTRYDPAFDLETAFTGERGRGTVASELERFGINNYRISEGGRVAHVTELFNGSTDAAGFHEMRVPLPALSAASRVAEPEMMSFKTADKAMRVMESDPSGVFIINLPATGLIAETGDADRTVEAAQYVDTCLGGIVDKVRAIGGVAMITSTHPAGPATPAKLPFHLVCDGSPHSDLRTDGSLADVGATLLALAGLEIPPEMTGRDLRIP
jgi:2,3-bisphosphoglycerate-independent phosphoglycerate mutase